MENIFLSLGVNISSFEVFFQNNTSYFIFGGAGIVSALTLIIKYFLAHLRKKTKMLMGERKAALDQVEEICKSLYNKDIGKLQSKLFQDTASKQELEEISNLIHTTYNDEVKIYLANTSLFTQKGNQAIKEKMLEYRRHCLLNVPLQNIELDSMSDYDETKWMELLDKVSKELEKFPRFVKKQSLLYSNFSQTFYSKLEKRKDVLSKELGRI